MMKFSGINVCAVASLVIAIPWLPGDCQCAAPVAPAGMLNTEQLVRRMAESSRERERALRDLEGSRVYRLQYHGLGSNKNAEMRVRMTFLAPATKQFTILSQSGSSLIIDHVLKKLLEGEQEALAPENRRLTALTSDNYEFSFADYEPHPEGDLYVLDVTPRVHNKFLYKGRIWVNAKDFAVTRIEGVPAKNPSFWIKHTQILHRYQKIGDFWLPAENRTESQIRLGGHALLTIEYTDYQINSQRSSLQSDSSSTQSTRPGLPIPNQSNTDIPMKEAPAPDTRNPN